VAANSAGRDLLALARPALAPTAAADVLAGAAFAGGAPAAATALAAVGSACLYMGGMVQNDLCDRERDAALGRNRPLARRPERVPRAYALLAALFVAGLALTALAGAALLGAAVLLAASAYNLGLKLRFPVDALVLGLARALNLGIGLHLAAAPGAAFPWLYAGAYFAYVAGVVAASRVEDLRVEPTVRLALLFVFPVQAAALLLPPLLWRVPVWPFAVAAALLLAALVAAYRGASRLATERYVRRSLLLVFLFHAAALAAHGKTDALPPLLGCAAASCALLALRAPPTSARPPAAGPGAPAGPC